MKETKPSVDWKNTQGSKELITVRDEFRHAGFSTFYPWHPLQIDPVYP